MAAFKVQSYMVAAVFSQKNVKTITLYTVLYFRLKCKQSYLNVLQITVYLTVQSHYLNQLHQTEENPQTL
jgi:hypothetical protein